MTRIIAFKVSVCWLLECPSSVCTIMFEYGVSTYHAVTTSEAQIVFVRLSLSIVCVTV